MKTRNSGDEERNTLNSRYPAPMMEHAHLRNSSLNEDYIFIPFPAQE